MFIPVGIEAIDAAAGSDKFVGGAPCAAGLCVGFRDGQRCGRWGWSGRHGDSRHGRCRAVGGPGACGRKCDEGRDESGHDSADTGGRCDRWPAPARLLRSRWVRLRSIWNAGGGAIDIYPLLSLARPNTARDRQRDCWHRELAGALVIAGGLGVLLLQHRRRLRQRGLLLGGPSGVDDVHLRPQQFALCGDGRPGRCRVGKRWWGAAAGSSG